MRLRATPCSRNNSKESILQNARERLGNSREEEVETALGEIAKIARLRLLDLVEADPGEDAERGGGRR
jgi:urate oxidase